MSQIPFGEWVKRLDRWKFSVQDLDSTPTVVLAANMPKAIKWAKYKAATTIPAEFKLLTCKCGKVRLMHKTRDANTTMCRDCTTAARRAKIKARAAKTNIARGLIRRLIAYQPGLKAKAKDQPQPTRLRHLVKNVEKCDYLPTFEAAVDRARLVLKSARASA